MKRTYFSWSICLLLISWALFFALPVSATQHDLKFSNCTENNEPLYCYEDDGDMILKWRCWNNGDESCWDHKDRWQVWVCDDESGTLIGDDKDCWARAGDVAAIHQVRCEGTDWTCADVELDIHDNDNNENPNNNYEQDNELDVAEIMAGSTIEFRIGVANILEDGTWEFENEIFSLPGSWDSTYDETVIVPENDMEPFDVEITIDGDAEGVYSLYFIHTCLNNSYHDQKTTVNIEVIQ